MKKLFLGLMCSISFVHASEFLEGKTAGDTPLANVSADYVMSEREVCIVNSLNSGREYVLTQSCRPREKVETLIGYIENNYQVALNTLLNHPAYKKDDYALKMGAAKLLCENNIVGFKQVVLMCDESWREGTVTDAFNLLVFNGNIEMVKWMLSEQQDSLFRPEQNAVRSELSHISKIIVGGTQFPNRSEMIEMLRQHLVNQGDISANEIQTTCYNPFSSQNPAFLPGRPGFDLGDLIGSMVISDQSTGFVPVQLAPVNRGDAFVGVFQPEMCEDVAPQNTDEGLRTIQPIRASLKELHKYISENNDSVYMDVQGYLWKVANYMGFCAATRGMPAKFWQNEALTPVRKSYDHYDDCLKFNGLGVNFHYNVIVQRANQPQKIAELILSPLSNEAADAWVAEQSSFGYNPKVCKR